MPMIAGLVKEELANRQLSSLQALVDKVERMKDRKILDTAAQQWSERWPYLFPKFSQRKQWEKSGNAIFGQPW